MDMLFELVEICHVFGGLLIDYLADLPSSNHQVGAASVVTILAVFALNFVHLRRSTSITSNIRDKKFALILILPLLLIVFGSAATMFKVIVVEPGKPASIEHKMSKITSIIGKVQSKLESIDLAKWEWKDGERLWSQFAVEIEASVSGLLDDGEWKKIYEVEDAFRLVENDMKDKMIAFKEWLRSIDSITAECEKGGGLDSANFDLWFNNTLEERIDVPKFRNSLEDSAKTLKISLRNILENRGKLEFVRRIMQERVDAMKNLLASVRADVEQSESRKTEVHRIIVEKMPKMTYAVIIKTIVFFTCSSFIVLSSIGIVSIIFYGGTIVSANRLDDSTDMTTFVTIIAAIVLFFTSVGYYGTNECTLKKNFGARDFLSPFVYQGSEIEVCPGKDHKIFGFMKKEILPTPTISQNLDIDGSKKKMFELLEKWNVNIRGSTKFGDGLKNMKTLFGRLDVLQKSNCSLLDEAKRRDFETHLEDIKPFIDINSNLENFVGNVIENIGEKTADMSPIIHGSYANISASLVQSVNELTGKVLSADASCKLICNNFGRIRGVICGAIENEIANYKTIIFFFLTGSVVAVILMIAVLRTYSFFFVDFGNEEDDSDSDSEWE